MKEIFKKGLSLIIVTLFLFSGFNENLKVIVNSFLVKAEESENLDGEEISESTDVEESEESEEESVDSELSSENNEEVSEETSEIVDDVNSDVLLSGEEQNQLNTMDESTSPENEGIMLLVDSDTYTYNGLTIKTNDGSPLTSATAA